MNKQNENREELKKKILEVIQDFNDDVKPYNFTNEDMINVLSSLIKDWTDVGKNNFQ